MLGQFANRPQSKVVGAEFASLALVRADGSLGERVDSFQCLKPVTAPSPVSTLEKAVLQSWATQHVSDAGSNAVDPTLVGSGIRSCLGLPIKTEKRLVGILGLYSTLIRAELSSNPLDILRELNLTPNAPVATYRGL